MKKVFILTIIIVAIFALYQRQISLQVAQDTKELVQKCKENSCYTEMLGSLTKNRGYKYALRVLAALQTLDPETKQCHLMAHKIASSEVERIPSNWKKLIILADENFCNYGFIHGALEGRMRIDPAFSINELAINEVCKIAKTSTIERADRGCAHVMGHLVLIETGGEIPLAVAMCQKAKENLQEPCLQGVFMENITRFNLILHTGVKALPKNDATISEIEALCNSYSGVPQAACWAEISSLYHELNPRQPEKVFRLCSRASTSKLRDKCYLYYIDSFVAQMESLDNNYLTSICNPYIGSEDNLYTRCMKELVRKWIGSSTTFTDEAIHYCSLHPQVFHEGCFSRIGELLSQRVSKNTQDSLCRSSPDEYQKFCINRKPSAIVSYWTKGMSVIESFVNSKL